MATLKHLGSKNADYGAAEQYLLFEHDEFTMKPVLDENGRLIPREDYRLSTLNCGGEDFAVACMRSNLRYEKNQRREDVKSHHYIISFDPRDGPDNGLTVDRAQALGEQFCKEHFPGHQALVCTHPDGHNHSGNIHVHIVINSLRIEEVPFLPYMDRPADTKAGCKHRCTDAALRYFKSEVMEMCHREGLYQIDLLNGSKNRVTDREYWAQKKGQAALDKQNAPMIAGGITPRQTKFETNKEKLRQTIRKALATAASFDEFSSLLLREGVTVKESRGRLILDDFGMERGTEYGLEQVFNVIDSRYRSGKPLIVTTNLTLDDLHNPEDTTHSRIYDRLLSMCIPVRFTGGNFRQETAQRKMESMKALMGSPQSRKALRGEEE